MKRPISTLAVLSVLSATALAQTGAPSQKVASVVSAPNAANRSIAVEKFDLALARPAAEGRIETRKVLPAEIQGVITDLVSIQGPGRHTEPSSTDCEVIWLVLAGKGTLRTKDMTYEVEGETIARAPLGWPWQIDLSRGEILHALRVRKLLSADDRLELQKYPQNNTAPYVKKFIECPAYREAIKSPKTVSRTLLPENYVPRVAMGTVETTGPDTVGAHRHPMLEQLFLGLKDNDIMVSADEAKAQLTSYAILHIPLGSNHGAQVREGKKLYYVWMDFFITKEGQEWLKMHKPTVEEERTSR
jgi:mannose-6-phosphate isomerase-like protein (cupin superfamily)